MSEFKTFEDLECWKSGRELRQWISQLSKSFPKEERFDLCSQINRAARSITANIAEGYGRFHYQENIQFCRQSRGSAYEVVDHLITALDEGYINEELMSSAKKRVETVVKLINGYVRYLGKKKSQ